mgnify:CR=1 FL=1
MGDKLGNGFHACLLTSPCCIVFGQLNGSAKFATRGTSAGRAFQICQESVIPDLENPNNKPLFSKKLVVLTGHAAAALNERKLAMSWIEVTAISPNWIEPDVRWPKIERRFRAIPEYENRIMRVVCLETEEEIRIITAFFDRKAKRPA